MKKSIVIALVIGLVAGAMLMPAEAKKKKKVERKVEGTYQAPTLIAAGTCSGADAIGCVSFPTAAGEKFITSALVTDSHGQPVYVSVQGDANGDAQDDTTYGSFCGELAEPLAIDTGAEIHFWVGLTPDPAMAGCAPAAGTSGSVAVTFSNLP